MLVADEKRSAELGLGNGMDSKSILRAPPFMPGLGMSVMSLVFRGFPRELGEGFVM